VTRGVIKQWLLNLLRDTTRSHEWLQFHEKQDYWQGEVDYTGPCQHDRDIDCDHWYDEHDTCVVSYNPVQRESSCSGAAVQRGTRSAVARIPGSMEHWWIAEDGSVQGASWSEGKPWLRYELAPPGSAAVNGRITALSRIPGSMEVWWVGPHGS